MTYMKFYFFSLRFNMAKLKDAGSVALCGKTACKFTKSTSLAVNTFDYQPGNSKQNICDGSRRKSPKKEE